SSSWIDVKRILVIEPSLEQQERYSEALQHEGFEVVSCTSGDDAASALLRREGSPIGAGILVWEIPGPPFGFELLTRSKRLRPDVPVIIVTGVLDAALAARAASLGADEFLEKPVQENELRACLNRLMTPRDLSSPAMLELRKRIVGESRSLLECLGLVSRI